MINDHSSPAVVSAEAAMKLPRWALITLLVAFFLPVLFSNDVWSGKNMISFGVAWDMYTGGFRDWLLPNIDKVDVASFGPLSCWIAALFIMILGPILGPIQAYHLTAGLWLTITTASIWYATYLLARRDEVQPVTFAFGGEAARKDYGRVVSDIAILLILGTYGLIVAFHEVTPTTAVLSFSALSLYGIVLSLDRLWKGSIIAGLAIGAAALTASAGTGLWCCFAAWLAIFFTPDYTSRSKRALITLSAAFLSFIIWPLIAFTCYPSAAAEWFANWFSQRHQDLSPLNFTTYFSLFKNLIWLTFPLWPIALWGIYSWRKLLKAAPFAISLSFLVVAVLSILFTGTETTTTILCVVPAMSVLAAFGVVSLKRSKENFIDLYSGIVFTLAILVAWIYFFAWISGEPTKMAYSLIRLAPQAKHGTSIFLFILAVAASLVWICAVLWRFFQHPIFVWRGAWLSALGLTSVWIVVMALFINLIDGARSLEPIVDAVHSAIQKDVKSPDCISEDGLSLSERAAFNYWGALNFDSSGNCPVQLRKVPLEDISAEGWNVIDIIRGRPRSDTHFLLLRKQRNEE